MGVNLKDIHMKATPVVFRSEDGNIEGLMVEGQATKGVVVTHPHPLYGGSMENNVVEAVVRAYGEKGYTTLRFNFRGVGRSEGRYDNGRGEQEDVRAAVAHLTQLGMTSIDLTGYSFGAWVNAKCIDSLTDVGRMVMVSPPVNFLDFSFLKSCPKIRLVIAGSEDEIAPPAMIEKILLVWNPESELKAINGADHFYWGKTGEIEAIIGDLIELEG